MKLVHFDGINFTHWKDKMLFMLTALKFHMCLNRFSKIPAPKPNESDSLKVERKKCEEDELLYRGHILEYTFFLSVL